MTDDSGWVRRRKPGFQHSEGTGDWCHRPGEEHAMSHRDRARMGSIWVCPECKRVWVAVLRPSMLDAVPHWSIKWKQMCEWRAKKWRQKWENQQR